MSIKINIIYSHYDDLVDRYSDITSNYDLQDIAESFFKKQDVFEIVDGSDKLDAILVLTSNFKSVMKYVNTYGSTFGNVYIGYFDKDLNPSSTNLTLIDDFMFTHLNVVAFSDCVFSDGGTFFDELVERYDHDTKSKNTVNQTPTTSKTKSLKNKYLLLAKI